MKFSWTLWMLGNTRLPLGLRRNPWMSELIFVLTHFSILLISSSLALTLSCISLLPKSSIKKGSSLNDFVSLPLNFLNLSLRFSTIWMNLYLVFVILQMDTAMKAPHHEIACSWFGLVKSPETVQHWIFWRDTHTEMGDREENHGKVLHIAGLHPHTREKDIKDEFSKHGDITECKLVVDPHTGESIFSLCLNQQRNLAALPLSLQPPKKLLKIWFQNWMGRSWMAE